MAISIHPIGGAGAEILGVDLSKRISKSDLLNIKVAFAKHGLIFFRDQSLSEEHTLTLQRTSVPSTLTDFLPSTPISRKLRWSQKNQTKQATSEAVGTQITLTTQNRQWARF